MPLEATGSEVYVSTIITIIYCYYDALEYTLNHLNSLKLKSYDMEYVADLCTAILVDYD